MRSLLIAASMLLASTTAFAEEVGILVTVQVVDVTGLPIPTAVVRHPKEEDRHRVNTATGEYETSVLYMPDGGELVFIKGMLLEFEVSAPGYNNAHIEFVVKKRKNVFPVMLQKMALDLDTEDDEMDDPVIQFGRDKPLD